MKRLAIGIMGSMALLAVSVAAQREQTLVGEIMDSQCAMMGSHEKMVQKERIAVEDKKQCTLTCVKGGGKFVLYDAAAKTVYLLDDQKRPEQFAGAKVTVMGSYDKTKNTIHVTGIKAGA